MKAVDVVNIFAAAFSIVLAIVALYLSLYFFRQSSTQAQEAQASAHSIAGSVSKLEKLFETLYADTFSMMRDTVTAMRDHIWPAMQDGSGGLGDVLRQAEEAAAARIDRARAELIDRVEEVSRRAGIADEQLTGLVHDLTPAVDRALEESSDAGANRDAKETFLMAVLRARIMDQDGQAFRELAADMRQFGFEKRDMVGALVRARAEGWLVWDGPATEVPDSAVVRPAVQVRRSSP